MPRLIRRKRVLRKQDTATLQEWLRVACRGGHADAVLALELELSARNVYDDAVHEPAFGAYQIADPEQRVAIQLQRLQTAAQRQSFEPFRAALFLLDPTLFAQAWLLARSFESTWTRAYALRCVAYWIAGYFRGVDAGVELVDDLICDKSPAEAIRVLEAEFASTLNEGEVQDA
jgi:hypothetical protein